MKITKRQVVTAVMSTLSLVTIGFGISKIQPEDAMADTKDVTYVEESIVPISYTTTEDESFTTTTTMTTMTTTKPETTTTVTTTSPKTTTTTTTSLETTTSITTTTPTITTTTVPTTTEPVTEPETEPPTEEPPTEESPTYEYSWYNDEEGNMHFEPSGWVISNRDWVNLCNCVANEAGACWISEYDKALVCEVIFNRYNNWGYGSIYDTIAAPGQFSGSSAYIDLEGYSSKVSSQVESGVAFYCSWPEIFNHGYYFFYGDGYYNHFR